MGIMDSTQAYTRMRVPDTMRPVSLVIHLIRAVRRNSEINGEKYYQAALQDVRRGKNMGVLASAGSLIDGTIYGKLAEKQIPRAYHGLMFQLTQLMKQDDGVDTYDALVEFNSRFLNGRGMEALIVALVIDAADLDVVAIDKFRGGEALKAAYGSRQTRRERRLGKELQTVLKTFETSDEDALEEAANRYVVFRFIDGGSMTEYKLRQELTGDIRSDRYLYRWFRDFDKALGFRRARRERRARTRGENR